MENMNDIVEELIAELDIPVDAPVMYEVWAVGYDEEDRVTDAELLIGTFDDPDLAESFARDTSTADVLCLAEDEEYNGFNAYVNTIHIEVETVISDDDNGTLNVGTIYKKTLALFEEVEEFVRLAGNEYEVIEETGNIQIPCAILKEYNKNDTISIIFTDEEQQVPIMFKIIFKTASGYYICEFV